MEKKDYLALVLREANLFVDEHEAELREAFARGEDAALPDELEEALEEQLREALIEADSLEDILKWSSCKEPPAELWRGASNWQDALCGAALGALAREVRVFAARIVSGGLPRMKGIQVGQHRGGSGTPSGDD